MLDYVGLGIFIITFLFSKFYEKYFKEKYNLWAAYLFKSILFITMAFFIVTVLNVFAVSIQINHETYMRNYVFSWLLALIGCLNLLLVMLGKGLNKRDISKDAFK